MAGTAVGGAAAGVAAGLAAVLAAGLAAVLLAGGAAAAPGPGSAGDRAGDLAGDLAAADAKGGDRFQFRVDWIEELQDAFARARKHLPTRVAREPGLEEPAGSEPAQPDPAPQEGQAAQPPGDALPRAAEEPLAQAAVEGPAGEGPDPGQGRGVPATPPPIRSPATLGAMLLRHALVVSGAGLAVGVALLALLPRR